MTTAVVAYLAHPIGNTDTGAEASRRGDNIQNAGAWVHFFGDATQWSIVAPWYVYAVAMDDAVFAARRLVDQLAVLERSDILIMCGGYVCHHMREEVRTAKRHGIPILDLTSRGMTPPLPTDDEAQVILAKAHNVVISNPRRVWLPRFTEADLAALHDARHALYTHLPDEHDDAVDILDRVIAAALDMP